MPNRNAREMLRGVEERIVDLVAQTCTPEQWVEFLKAPLDLAAAQGDELLAEKLMDAGAKSENVLHEACRGGRVDLVNNLLRSGAPPDSPNTKGSTPVHYAVQSGKPEIIHLLTHAGAPIDALDAKGRTPLHWSSDGGAPPMLVESLLAAGADVGRRYGRFNRSSMHLAARGGHVNVLRVLIHHGGDVNDVDSDGHTALFYAATSGSVETIDLLIQDWADIEAQEKNGDTPLYSAVAAHKPKAVLALLKHGADVNMQNWRGQSPLFYAAAFSGVKGSADVVEILLRGGADAQAISSSGETASDVVGERVDESKRAKGEVERVRELLSRA